MKIKEWFGRAKSPSTQPAQDSSFDRILELAVRTAKSNPKALPDLVRLIGRRLQSQWIYQVAAAPEHSPATVDVAYAFFSLSTVVTTDGKTLYNLLRKTDEARDLRLGRDLVLPWPWNRSRMVSNLSMIGADRSNGAWRFDPSNHFVELWLPMGIGWVTGGNHSIAMGIVQAEGSVRATRVVDTAPLLSQIRTDGRSYHRLDGSVIAEVRHPDMAAILEIGRMMLEHEVSA